MPAALETPPLPEKIGRYQVLCELGAGGMAVVYLARTEGPGGFERLFAIKMIHRHLCRKQKFIDLFLNEARIAARIHHPNVIPVYDIDTDDDRYYLSMDYVSGETLALALMDTWNEGVAFPLDMAVHLMAEACEGLHAAHELTDPAGTPLGVIHRDVAPQNILIGYDGIVRVMDFGLAKALDQVSATNPGTWRGTVPYMSPEQIRSEPLDRRVDIFAFGVVLWETTVGRRLFKDTTELATASRVLSMKIPRPVDLRATYPEKLSHVIMRALERDREKRYQSAREMGEDLEDVLASMGKRVSPVNVERFMKDLFPARYQKRLEMERMASSRVKPARIETLPPVPEVPTEVLRLTELEEEPSDPTGVARRFVEGFRSGVSNGEPDTDRNRTPKPAPAREQDRATEPQDAAKPIVPPLARESVLPPLRKKRADDTPLEDDAEERLESVPLREKKTDARSEKPAPAVQKEEGQAERAASGTRAEAHSRSEAQASWQMRAAAPEPPFPDLPPEPSEPSMRASDVITGEARLPAERPAPSFEPARAGVIIEGQAPSTAGGRTSEHGKAAGPLALKFAALGAPMEDRAPTKMRPAPIAPPPPRPSPNVGGDRRTKRTFRGRLAIYTTAIAATVVLLSILMASGKDEGPSPSPIAPGAKAEATAEIAPDASATPPGEEAAPPEEARAGAETAPVEAEPPAPTEDETAEAPPPAVEEAPTKTPPKKKTKKKARPRRAGRAEVPSLEQDRRPTKPAKSSSLLFDGSDL